MKNGAEQETDSEGDPSSPGSFYQWLQQWPWNQAKAGTGNVICVSHMSYRDPHIGAVFHVFQSV